MDDTWPTRAFTVAIATPLLFRSLITMVYSLLAIGIDIQALKEAVSVDIGLEVKEVELVGKSEHHSHSAKLLLNQYHR